MIDVAPLWGFVLVSAVVLLSPGADTMLLIRASMDGGPRRGFPTLAGIQLGNTILTTLVASGLGVVIAAHHHVLLGIRLVGGLYLVWLALGSARSAIRTAGRASSASGLRGSRIATAHGPATTGREQLSPRGAFTQGLVTNLTNAKLLVFFLSFLPQFLGSAHNSFAQLELLAGVFIMLAILWETVLVSLASRMNHLMRRGGFAVALETISAVVFAALGAGIIWEALR